MDIKAGYKVVLPPRYLAWAGDRTYKWFDSLEELEAWEEKYGWWTSNTRIYECFPLEFHVTIDNVEDTDKEACDV